MPKRKSCNQSLKQRVKALEMRLGVSALNSRLGLRMDEAGRIEGFGLHSPDAPLGAVVFQATDVEVDGVKISRGAYLDATELNRVSAAWARFGTISEQWSRHCG